MPIRPHPISIRCPRCGWHTVWQPEGNALSYDGLPLVGCPRCGAEELTAGQAGPIDRLLLTLASAIKIWKMQ